MALWRCTGCTTRYSVGAPACPHCGATDYIDDDTAPSTEASTGASTEPAVADELRSVEVTPAPAAAKGRTKR